MAKSSLAGLIGNAMTAFTQAKQGKQDREENAKYKKAMTQLLELQIDAQRRQGQARTQVGSMMAPQPIAATPPEFQFPEEGQLGEIQTTKPAGPTMKPGMSFLEMMSDPEGRLAAVESGMSQELQKTDQLTAQSELVQAMQASEMPPVEFFNTPEGSALAVRAGVSPEEFMRMKTAGAGSEYRPTANIQDFTFSQKNPEFLPFLQSSAQARAGGTAVGRGFGEAYIGIQNAGLKAPQTIGLYNRVLDLADRVSSGRLAGIRTTIAEVAQEFGIDVEGLDDTQAFRALSNKLALELRNPAGGAGMPGAMSDADRAFLAQSVPNLVNTPEGNKILAESAIKVAERDRDVAALAREYRKKHSEIDEGFFDELAAWSESHPLFQKGSSDGWEIIP